MLFLFCLRVQEHMEDENESDSDAERKAAAQQDILGGALHEDEDEDPSKSHSKASSKKKASNKSAFPLALFTFPCLNFIFLFPHCVGCFSQSNHAHGSIIFLPCRSLSDFHARLWVCFSFAV